MVFHPLQPEPFYPQKKFPGEVRGYQEPSGLDKQDSTWQDRKTLQGQTNRTSHRNQKPSWAGLEAEGFLWAWRGVRGPYRVPQQPLPYQRQGCWNGLRGHKTRSHLPQTSLQGQDRQDLIKMFLWAQQDKHGSPGRDVWTGSMGLGLAAAGGHESVAIRRAWVSGGHWVSGGPGTREPAGGLGIATAGGGYLPRSAGMRARGQRTRLPWQTKHRNKNKN